VTRREERGHPHSLRLVPLALALSALSGCEVDDWKPEVLLQGKSVRADATLKRGREQYSMYCAGCHGEQGDGEGPAARFLSPKPRDFRKGRVKFAAVPANTLPRDEDLINTMNHGLHGTSMPAWNLVAHEDQLAMVAYIKTFSDVWQKEAPGAVVPIKPDPWRKKGPQKAIAEGERVYHGIAACSSCHPHYATQPAVVEAMKAFEIPVTGFRESMYESVEKDSDWGAPIKPPDFLVDRTKIAATREELVRVIAAGVGGTAMPSWGDSLSDKQLWGLAYYVEWLVEQRGTPEGAALRKSLLEQPPYALPKPEPPREEPAPAAVLDGGAAAGDGGKPMDAPGAKKPVDGKK
jgi:mono/diheme cytochrome c family protein